MLKLSYRKGYYFYSPQSSTVIKSKMAATTISRTRTRYRPPKIRLHCRLVDYLLLKQNNHSFVVACWGTVRQSRDYSSSWSWCKKYKLCGTQCDRSCAWSLLSLLLAIHFHRNDVWWAWRSFFSSDKSVSSTNGFTRGKPYKGHDLDQNERSKLFRHRMCMWPKWKSCLTQKVSLF